MKKSGLLIVLLIFVSSSMIFAANGDLGVSKGANGSESAPWLIEDFTDFQAFCDDETKWAAGVHTHLEINLDLDPSLPGRQVYSRAPIAPDTDDANGTTFDGTAYAGKFDGNGAAIFNLEINGEYFCGLFGKIDSGCEITNLVIDNADIFSSRGNVGFICGYNDNGTLSGCHSTGVATAAFSVGGISGFNNEGTVSNCHSSGIITGNYKIGGLLGNNYGNISNCSSDVDITGNETLGGLVGYCYHGSVINSFSDGTVTGSTKSVGGLVGWLNSSAVSDCYSTSAVVNDGEQTGGLVGKSSYGTIYKCYSTGSVNGYDYVGALIGYSSSGEVANCFSTGTVYGNEYIGGLVGYSKTDISGCYFTGSVTGDNNSIGGLAGRNSGNISRSFANCSVESKRQFVGGLVGENKGYIRLCFSAGSVSGSSCVGGLAGVNEYYEISNCYSVCSAIGFADVGGLVGSNYSGKVSYCYSTGPVGAFTSVGGLVGESFGSVSNCYSYIFSGPDNGMSVTLDDNELLEKSNFLGFDFADISSDGTNNYWIIEPGCMPRLSWQTSPGFENPLARVTTSLSGIGTSDDPFMINDYDDLLEFRNNTSLRIGYYILNSDVDLSGLVYSNAFVSGPFCGVFNGNGHTISNLIIDGDSYLGFFDKHSGVVKNLGIENSHISGSGNFAGALAACNNGDLINCYSSGEVYAENYVGGLAGTSDGIIAFCHSGCSVNAADSSLQAKIGGLVGFTGNDNFAINSFATGQVACLGDEVGGLIGRNVGGVYNCFATGSVHGGNYVGGLFGRSDSCNVNNCYSSGYVSGNDDIGGVAGYGHGLTNCFWDIEKSGITDPETGMDDTNGMIGLTTAEMKTQANFNDAGWDFNNNITDGTSDIWKMDSESGYPVFNEYHINLSGHGVTDNPYLITNAIELGAVMYHDISACYELTSDIDLEGIVFSQSIIPVFKGCFEGNHYVVKNMTINGADHCGVFGKTSYNSEISNLGVKDLYINSDMNNVGGLVGENGSTINNCYSTGEIFWDSAGRTYSSKIFLVGIGGMFGGLVGNNAGDIDNSYSTCNIFGYKNAGGLAGGNNGGCIRDCFSLGDITCPFQYAGGLIGYNTVGSIINCYSESAVTGSACAGGLVGKNDSEVSSCFAAGEVTANNYVGGSVGINLGSISICYSTGGVTGDNYTGGFVGYNKGIISNCYSTGSLICSGDLLGGLIGHNNELNGIVSNSIWNVETSGFTDPEDGYEDTDGMIGHSTAEMQIQSTFTDTRWDFAAEADNGTEDFWHMPYNATGYPMLYWQRDIPGDITGSYGINLTDLSELSSNWLDSYNLTDLQKLAQFWLEQ